MLINKNTIVKEELIHLEGYIQKSKKISLFFNSFLDLDSGLCSLKNESKLINSEIIQLKKYINIFHDYFEDQFKANVNIQLENEKITVTYPTETSSPIKVYFSKKNNITLNIKSPKNIKEFKKFNQEIEIFKNDFDIFNNEDFFNQYIININYLNYCITCLNNLNKEYQLNITLLNNKNKYKIDTIQGVLKNVKFNSITDFIYSQKDTIQDREYQVYFYTYKLDFQNILFTPHTLIFKRNHKTQEINYKISTLNAYSEYNNLLDFINNGFKIGNIVLYNSNQLKGLNINLDDNRRISYENFVESRSKEIKQYKIEHF
jgi:hypothetical protein